MTQQTLVFRFTEDDVLAAPRECGLLTVPDLVRQVREWRADGGPCLVVDLSQVDAVDVTVFRALVWASRHCRAGGRDLVVVEPPAEVWSMREAPLLPALVRCYPDLASAWQAVGTPSHFESVWLCCLPSGRPSRATRQADRLSPSRAAPTARRPAAAPDRSRRRPGR